MRIEDHPLLRHRSEVTKAFPKAAELYKGSCMECVVAKVASLLRSVMPQAEAAGLSFDVREAVALPAPRVAPMPEGLDKVEAMAGFSDELVAGPRKACPDCVLKHLAQASVLIGEAELGYPDHVEYAIRHLRRAGPMVPMRHTRPLAEALDILKKGATHLHLAKAKAAVEGLMRDMADPVPTSYWKAVGHLAEASEECSGDFPEFANKLRMERLRMMGDQTYCPPMMALLLELKELREAKDESEGLRDDSPSGSS